MDGLKQIGPNFVGLQNFISIFTPRSSDGKMEIFSYTGNTMIMWVMGAVPQIVFALLLAVIFTSERMKIKGQGFFKTVIYMPNLIMASAFSSSLMASAMKASGTRTTSMVRELTTS